MAAHAEDVAGLEGLDIARPGAPALVSKGLGHLGGAHHVAVVVGVDGILGVHHVVDDPADVTGAVETGIVVLVPTVVRIVAVRVVGTVLIGVVGILLLEEVDPALGEADGHGLVGGKIVLPIPARAVDVQRSADGFESGLEVVLEGALACLAADGRGVGLGNKGEVNGVAVDLGGLADGIRGNGDSGGAGFGVVDLVHGGIGILLAADGNSAGAHLGDLTLSRGLGSGGSRNNAVLDGQVVNIALLKGVLDAVAAIVGNLELNDLAVCEEAVDEVVLAGVLGGDGAVILHAEIHGIFIAAVHLAEEVCEDLGGAHISVTVGVGQTGAVEVPAEVAGPGLSVLGAGGRGGVGDVASQHGVIAIAPLGVVLGHVLGDELVGLAVLVVVAVGVEGAELNAAAALTGLAVGRRGVQEDDGAVVADAEDGPHVAAHAEDVAGLEAVSLDIAGELAPALVSEGLGHLDGAHHVAVALVVGGALSVHHVVDSPANIGRAVHTGVVVLVPAVVRIVAVRVVAVVLVGVVGVLLLEEVDPALGQANGQRLVGRVHILPVPAAAVNVQRGADRVHRGLEVVLEGAHTGRAADGSGVRLGDKGEVNGVAVNLRGLAGKRGEIGHGGNGGGAGSGVADLVDVEIGGARAVLEGHSRGVDLLDRAFGAGRGSGGVGHDTVFNRQIVDIAFLKLVLDGILIVAGNGILHFFTVGVEAMDKVGLAVSFHGAVILHAEIHVSLVAGASRAVSLKGGSRRDQKRGKHREDK